ncbi:MAG TPA: SAM-dependent methyltransferase [Ktedonobacteraceae bacterium]|nr:SAM-dependent methyltransferase [Ktedonobacteraceae bacterium]
MSSRAVASEYQQLIRDNVLSNQDLIKATFSGQHRDRTFPWMKVIVRPVLVRGQKHMQFSYFDAKKDITKNYLGDEIAEKLEQILAAEFKNVHVQTAQNTIDIRLTQKGKAFIHSTTTAGQPIEVNLTHDRQKSALLTANDAGSFLKAVGIMTQDGKIKAEMQSKFRQINEFLRLVEQTGELERFNKAPLTVVDCGCGNAYLTFAFYHYLNDVLKIPTHLTGIDVNGELLTRHTEKSRNLDWPGLTFQTTRIIDFQPVTPPDIVLALHACDTATDEALAQGIRWQSKMIISAPCCQHQLQEQLEHQPTPRPFEAVVRHGILKERLGDILTDSFRALILRIMGYQTEVVQFVSSEHTAKNLMIRAVKSLKVGDAKFVQEYNDLKDFWKVTPYLEQLLGEDFTAIISK